LVSPHQRDIYVVFVYRNECMPAVTFHVLSIPLSIVDVI